MAVTIAVNAAVTPTIRLLPGTYTTPIRVDVPTALPLQIVGTGATIAVTGAVPAIVVDKGANVSIRGLNTTSEQVVQCGTSNAPPSFLSLGGVKLTAIGNPAIQINRCSVQLVRSEVLLAATSDIGLYSDASLEADRVRIHGNGLVGWAALGDPARVNVRVTNSLIENMNDFALLINDPAAPGTKILFAFATLHLARPLTLCDESAPFRSVTFENSIIAASGTSNAFNNPISTNCTFVGTMLTRQASPPSGTYVADPLFVNVMGRDFHLTATSPAVDAALPGTFSVGLDLDGVTRPQGPSPDLGAYERAP